MIYRFAAPVPIRGLLVSSALALLGAVALVLGAARILPSAFVVVGLLLVLGGAALNASAFVMWRRAAARVEVTGAGWAVLAPPPARRGSWDDIVRVALSDDERRLSLVTGQGVTHLVRPDRSQDALWRRLVDDVTRRLDASRGYREL